MPDRTTTLCSVASFAVTFALSISASADVFNMPAGQTSLQLVSVGNAGNAGNLGGPRGTVGYTYKIGKFEVTVGQYSSFLNSVAATDTYMLYNPAMASNANIAGIAQSGLPGSYTYNVIGSPNKPVSCVGWGDAARFVNWLTNGQPIGAQGPGSTETGSYTLNGATTDAALLVVGRNASARYVIPSPNEWYKAAYYDPTKGGSNYWVYPMRTDTLLFSAQPPGIASPNAAFAANFYQDDATSNGYNDGYAATGTYVYLTSQNYLTEVGAYTSATSYYGTFDQGGNVGEWNDALLPTTQHPIEGSSWDFYGFMMDSSSPFRISNPSAESWSNGFRIALVPEPATLGLLTLGAVFLIRRPGASKLQRGAALA